MNSKTKSPSSNIHLLNPPKLILFYDGDCGLCNRAVHFVLKHDKKLIFHYASLHSQTAKKLLASWRKEHPLVDSLVLLEDGDLSWYSKGVFRTCWLLGGFWAIPGLLSFLPNWLLFPYNFLYRLLASHRGRFVCFNPYECKLGLIKPNERFLP